MIHECLYIKKVAGKGRGIFSTEPIPAGTIIESSPVIVMTSDDRLLLDKTLLHDYIFEWQPGGANMCCMALGWIPLYNHSFTSNCEYFMDYEDHSMYIQTVKDITADEELTINYNGDWNDPGEVWFNVSEGQ